MKVRKTSGAGMVGKTGYTPSKSSTTEISPTADSAEIADTVSISDEAIAAASRAEAVDAVEAVSSGADGPLPDPHETSRAMLEKELARVFWAIYL